MISRPIGSLYTYRLIHVTSGNASFLCYLSKYPGEPHFAAASWLCTCLMGCLLRIQETYNRTTQYSNTSKIAVNITLKHCSNFLSCLSPHSFCHVNFIPLLGLLFLNGDMQTNAVLSKTVNFGGFALLICINSDDYSCIQTIVTSESSTLASSTRPQT